MARNQNQTSTSNRGFASMDSEKQRRIAAEGGRSVPAEKRSFSQDHELAREAGQKGGQNSHRSSQSGSSHSSRSTWDGSE